MFHQLLLICCASLLFKLAYAYRTCFKESNSLNYLFLNRTTQLNLPLLPLNCIQCQSAYQIDIQLIDEQQFIGNRTIQRVKIFLRNFEIEDTSYICLIKICPIIVEYGSDFILVNVTSPLFSHVFLSMTYLKDDSPSTLCSIQTRFALLSFHSSSLICTEKIYLHPQKNNQISGQVLINDCRANLFEENIYRTSINFQHINFPITDQTLTMKSSGKQCEYIFDSTSYLQNITLIQTEELLTRMIIFPFYNPWKKDIYTFDSCRTKLIPYRDMSFTNDIIHIRNIHVEQGQTIQIQCPIDGSEKYLKYTWYYQRYQPKYQISNNRTLVLNNITEHMQGKYMCIGDDENELLEFEMTLHISTKNTTNLDFFHPIIIILLITLFIFFCLILTIIVCYSFKRRSSTISSSDDSINKQKSLNIHHDVMVTIQYSAEQSNINSLWNQIPYDTFDYIDNQPIDSLPSTNISSWSWMEQSNFDIRQEQIAHRFSTRHRNVNGQPPTQLAIQISTDSDMTQLPLVKSNQISDLFDDNILEQHNDMKILKISVPLMNHYPIVKSNSSNISFDSQIELDQFNKMTSMCMDNEAFIIS